MAKKLDFSKMILHLDGAVYTWKTQMSAEAEGKALSARHELHGKHEMTLEFWATSELCSDNQFELISELMAEAWLKATTKWQALHERPLFIEAEPATPAANKTQDSAKGSIFPPNSPPVPSPAID